MTLPLVLKIPIKPSSLRLDITLQCGQSFRWTAVSSDKWRGVIDDTLWTLCQDNDTLICHLHNPSKDEHFKSNDCDQYKSLISNYFNLDYDLDQLYEQWSKSDDRFSLISKDIPGLRLLKQEPLENVFSFICSSNNNITRITNLVGKLCSEFGNHLMEVDETSWHAFPPLSALANESAEQKLRNLGFGYRAKYIKDSADKIIRNGSMDWLYGLRKLNYNECHSELRTLPGIGAKVADCICLMSMGHFSAIPVDTHVFQIAARDYLPHLKKSKSLTDKVYKEIGDHFRGLYGDSAGWAHCILFTADLKNMKRKLSIEGDSNDSTISSTKRKSRRRTSK